LTHPFSSSVRQAVMASVFSAAVRAFQSRRTVVVVGAAARAAMAGRREVVIR
jgi:hypothetical protein